VVFQCNNHRFCCGPISVCILCHKQQEHSIFGTDCLNHRIAIFIINRHSFFIHHHLIIGQIKLSGIRKSAVFIRSGNLFQISLPVYIIKANRSIRFCHTCNRIVSGILIRIYHCLIQAEHRCGIILFHKQIFCCNICVSTFIHCCINAEHHGACNICIINVPIAIICSIYYLIGIHSCQCIGNIFIFLIGHLQIPAVVISCTCHTGEYAIFFCDIVRSIITASS